MSSPACSTCCRWPIRRSELIGPPDETPELVRMANDALAEICRKHPDRFPAFIASLPMNNVEASVQRSTAR